MRIGFLLVLLAGSVFYSYVAFADLSFMTRTGRLGPGFFPRLVGMRDGRVVFDESPEAITEERYRALYRLNGEGGADA